MTQRVQVVGELKRTLKEHGVTYAVVARSLNLSVASVKRLFSTGNFTLERIDVICELVGIQMSDLIRRASERTEPLNKLTFAQEQEIVSDPRLFLVTWLVLSRTKFPDIVKDYSLTELEVQRYLSRLHRLNVIELQPFNRVRLLVSRHFSWRAGGPVQRYIHQRLLKEFFAADFSNESDAFLFHGAAVSKHSLARIKRVLQNSARECSEIIEGDQGVPGSRSGAAFVLALRPWRYSGFAQFERTISLRDRR
jgi:DNA-binding Xre family transcriptional regulator